MVYFKINGGLTMNRLTTSSLPEDQHITYLSGLPTGNSPIGYMDKYNAYRAQKHPIGNQIISKLSGVINGIGLTALGLTAYPLFRDGVRQTFFASRFNVCTTFASNVCSTGDILFSIDRIFSPITAPSEFTQYFGWPGLYCQALYNSAWLDESNLMKLRGLNYLGNIGQTLSDNAGLVIAGAIALTAYFTSTQKKDYVDQEIEAEESLKRSLADRYEKIGTRLLDLENNKQAQGCAERILKNQLQINQEIEALQLPSLSWKEIKNITKPVFDAAQKIISCPKDREQKNQV
jgi:hypothetical protein